jgi:thiosulfate dehydrogenase [quinone] large subunit
MPVENGLLRVIRPGVRLFLRLALGGTFLISVADRFGLWGPPGAKNVAWGDFAHFTRYAGLLNPWAPAALVPILAVIATCAEIVLGMGLILGLFTRWCALLSGFLILLFALGMCIGTGFKSAVNASVFSASAAAFALLILGAGPWSLDRLRH